MKLVATSLATLAAILPHHNHHGILNGKRCHSCDKGYNRVHHKRVRLAFGRWAIPPYVVYCESKFKNEPPHEYAPGIDPSGFYQIISSTWKAYGGRWPWNASEHTKHEQDVVASRVLRLGGLKEWACA